MSKVITDQELAAIVTGVFNSELIDDADQYERFLEGVGDLIADHFGGQVICTTRPQMPGTAGRDDPWAVHFQATDSLPADGGIFKDLDPDVTVEEWFKEAGLSRP